MKTLAIVSLVLFILTAGCGIAIYFGGEAFRDGVKGHIVLGFVTLISVAALVYKVLIQ